MNRVAFKLPDVGLREITGMAFVEDGFLVLKIETKLIGLVDAERSTVKIEPGALSGARIKYGVLRDRLILRPKQADLLDVVPGEHISSLELRVARKYRDELEALVDELEPLMFVGRP